jgi:two-component system copper resistance phosphate regulon response regulator CusR
MRPHSAGARNNTQMASILIVEDDEKTASALSRGLEIEGHTPVVALEGSEGLALARSRDFDCILLDWMLPGVDGIQILDDLRALGHRTPVLLLTARDAVTDRVRGLDSGADDYLVKPFAFSELVARIRVLLRRSGEREDLARQIADLHIDLTNRHVRRAGRRIVLSPREFDLLWYLARHHGQTVSRQMLARDVWHETQRATPLDNVIDVHVAHLRKKIDEGFATRLLHTVRGVGFVLREGPRSE